MQQRILSQPNLADLLLPTDPHCAIEVFLEHYVTLFPEQFNKEQNFEAMTRSSPQTFNARSSQYLLKHLSELEQDLVTAESTLQQCREDLQDVLFIPEAISLKQRKAAYNVHVYTLAYAMMLKNLGTNNLRQVLASQYDAFNLETKKHKMSKEFFPRLQKDNPSLYTILCNDDVQQAREKLDFVRNIGGHNDLGMELCSISPTTFKSFDEKPTDFFKSIADTYLLQTAKLYNQLCKQMGVGK